MIDHVNYTHSYVAYGDEKVTKIDRTFRKDRFEPEHAVSIYDNYRYYTLKDGIYTRHHTKKIMMKYIARTYGVTACDFGSNHDIPDGAVVEWMHLEPLVKD